MEFRFTQQEEAWRQEVREFFQREITPEFLRRLQEQSPENTNRHSRELYSKIAQRGWLGLSWPREYGGQERSHYETAIFFEEARRAGCPPGTVISITNTVHFFGGLLLRVGIEEQKRRFLPQIIRGELTSCQGLTEPNAGSDLAGVEMRAVEDGDDYVLNGTKIFNGAHHATHMFTVARTNPEAPKHKGISLFLVDLKSSGISITPLHTNGRNRRNIVTMENVRVPRFNLLGERDRGWYQLAACMDLERSQAAIPAALERMLERFLELVKTAERNGKPLRELPSVRFALADLATQTLVSRLLGLRVLWMQTQERSDTGDLAAPMAKLFQSELKERLVSTAMDILGEYSALESWGEDLPYVPLEGALAQTYRDIRADQVAAGTSEIQRNIIALRGLGLPRG
ncbi:MAG: acyl-CoA dehydrogenase family protein [Dehalococcoidia bacterium]